MNIMKSWKFIPRKFKAAFKKVMNSRGQTILEFMLLLLVLTTVSYGFVALVNMRIASYWEYAVNIIVYDKPVKTIKIKE